MQPLHSEGCSLYDRIVKDQLASEHVWRRILTIDDVLEDDAWLDEDSAQTHPLILRRVMSMKPGEMVSVMEV